VLHEIAEAENSYVGAVSEERWWVGGAYSQVRSTR